MSKYYTVITEVKDLGEPTTIHTLFGSAEPFVPVGSFNGYIVAPFEIVLDTARHCYLGGQDTKLTKPITIKVTQPDDLDVSDHGRVGHISSQYALKVFHDIWEGLTLRGSGFGGSRIAAFTKHGEHRAEIQDELLKIMKIHGVTSEVRTRIKNALNADFKSVEDAVGLLTDTQLAINYMDQYGIGHYGRDEVMADYIATRIVEQLAPPLSHYSLDHMDDEEHQWLWNALPTNMLSSHILASHKGLSEHHHSLPNLASYLTDLSELTESGESID